MTEDAKAAVEWLRAVPPKANPYVYGGADAAADAREEARCRRQNEVRQHMLALLALLALLDAVTAERDALRAQVERVRSRCQDRLDYGEDGLFLAGEILDALEGK